MEVPFRESPGSLDDDGDYGDLNTGSASTCEMSDEERARVKRRPLGFAPEGLRLPRPPRKRRRRGK